MLILQAFVAEDLAGGAAARLRRRGPGDCILGARFSRGCRRWWIRNLAILQTKVLAASSLISVWMSKDLQTSSNQFVESQLVHSNRRSLPSLTLFDLFPQ